MNTYDEMYAKTLETVQRHDHMIASAIMKLEQAVKHYPHLETPTNHLHRYDESAMCNPEGEAMPETMNLLGTFDDQGARLMDLNDRVHAQGETLQHIIETLNQLDLPDTNPPGEK